MANIMIAAAAIHAAGEALPGGSCRQIARARWHLSAAAAATDAAEQRQHLRDARRHIGYSDTPAPEAMLKLALLHAAPQQPRRNWTATPQQHTAKCAECGVVFSYQRTGPRPRARCGKKACADAAARRASEAHRARRRQKKQNAASSSA